MTEVINSATPIENALLGVHPRLYATAEEIQAVRGRLDEEPWSSLLARVLSSADQRVASGCPAQPEGDARRVGNGLAEMAAAWRFTDKEVYRDAALEHLRIVIGWEDWGQDLLFGHTACGAALAFDWLVDEFKPGERAEMAAGLYAHGQALFEQWSSAVSAPPFCYAWNHMAVPTAGLAALGGVLFDEVDGIVPWVRYTTERARLMIAALGPDGVSPEGVAYGQYHAEYLARLLEIQRRLMGVDLMPASAWWQAHGLATLAHTLPRECWHDQQVFLMLGDADAAHWYGPDPQLRLCAHVFRDGVAQWLADELHTTEQAGNTAAHLNLLWHDETVVPVKPESLPTLHHAIDQDIAFFRSGWDGDESVMLFTCGPNSGHHALTYNHNISGGHMHPQAGSVTLFAYGERLLTESGYPGKKMTAFENAALINGRGQTGEGTAWFEDLEFRRGKASPKMLAVGGTDAFAYAMGDVRNAYDDDLGLTVFRRHLYYFAPDAWLIVDDIAGDAPLEVELLFHADKDFVEEGPGRFVRRGESAALHVHALAPVEVTGTVSKQQVPGASLDARCRDQSLLTLSVKDAAAARFVTFLHACPAEAEPGAAAELSIDESGAGVVEITRGDTVQRFAIALTSAPAATPLLSLMG